MVSEADILQKKIHPKPDHPLLDTKYLDLDHKLVDKLLANRLRLAIMAALHHSDETDFTSLRNAVKATDGNLSVQLRHLREAGFIIVNKTTADGREQTYMALSDKGRMALIAWKRLMKAWFG